VRHAIQLHALCSFQGLLLLASLSSRALILFWGLVCCCGSRIKALLVRVCLILRARARAHMMCCV
jgi:hypothetical protein